jgi:mitogen-activated protein kinase organizer 1
VSHSAPLIKKPFELTCVRAQTRTPIQSLEEAKDAIQTLYVGSNEIVSGSVDGHVRTYDLRKGQLTSDYLGRKYAHLIV